MKNFPKKVCLEPEKCKEAKNSYRGSPTKFASETSKIKGLKLNSKIFITYEKKSV
jgi:hypothetical protein